jgi:two-component system, LuxR family, response regulator FixJ
VPEKTDVFVVDDDAAVRKALRRAIAAAGHAVEVYESAEAFLREARPARPACLVLDVRMPGMTGVELQQAVKDTAHDVPIVFISGHIDAQTRAQALEGGAVAVIDKPVDTDELLSAVAEGLRLSEAG